MGFSLSGGVEVYGFISPTDIVDTYPVIDPLYGIDGFRNVNLLNDLNLIPFPRRRSGMVVGVSGGTTYYKLNPSPWSGTLTDWTQINLGNGVSIGVNQGGGSEVFKNINFDTIFFRTITGGTNTTVSTVGDLIVVDVYIPPDLNTYVTGFTYQDNTFTIYDNSGNTFNATLNDVTGLTVNGNLTVTGETNLSGLTNYYNTISGTNPNEIINLNYLTGYVQTNDVYVTGATYTEATDSSDYTQWELQYHSTPIGSPPYIFSGENTYTTGGTYDNNTAKITFLRNDGKRGYTVDLSSLDLNDTYVTGGTSTGSTNTSPNATIELTYNQDVPPGTYSLQYKDTFITGFTYNNNNFTLKDNSGNTFVQNISVVTGLTINGDLNISGNISHTGNTEQVGYDNLIGDLNITGNTNQIGNDFLTGDTIQLGNQYIIGNTDQFGSVYLSGDTGCTLTVIGDVCIDGDLNITGNTNQIGNFNITGNTNQIGNFIITGNTTQSGNTVQTGNFHITGNTSHLGNSSQTGNVTLSGNTFITGNTTQFGTTNQLGDFNITGDTTQLGNFDIAGNTFQLGNFDITGDTFQSGNTTQTGNFHITGNTSQLGNSTQTGNVTLSGDTFITGNTTQSGNTDQIGNQYLTGNTNQIGNSYLTGDTEQFGSVYLSGDTGCTLTVIGDVCIEGDLNITGNTNQIGDFTITGDTTQSGNTTQIGNYNLTGNTDQLGYLYIVSATTGCTFAVTGNTCLDGDLDISGNTFMSGNFCMNNMNSTGQTGTNCLDTSLIPTGTTVIHQFQGESGILAHIGDLATGEPNSRGYSYFENNATNTSFVTSGLGIYTEVIGAPTTFPPYNNLFTVTTGATTATTNKLTYNYPPASGTSSATYLKFTVSLTLRNGQNQALTFQVRRKRGAVFTFLPIGMSITPQANNVQGITFNGISDAWNGDEFQVVVKNDTGANPANSIIVVDLSFSMFT